MTSCDSAGSAGQGEGHRRGPARFLDRPLLDGERGATEPGWFIERRIAGIDDLLVIRHWLEVEHRLDRGPRDTVVEMLEARTEQLREIGERPDRLECGPRRPPEHYHDRKPDTEWTLNGEPWNEVDRDGVLAGLQTDHVQAVVTDGGDGA